MNDDVYMNFFVQTKFILAGGVAFLVVIFGPAVLATDFSSTNFISRDPVIDDFGGFSSGSDEFQQINAGGQTVIGESQSTNFIIRAGFLYFSGHTPRQQNWRWYDDETNETPSTALAAENTTPSSVQNGNLVKLRMTIAELAGVSSSSIKYRLQFSTLADFSSDVNNVVASASCGGSDKWCYANGAGKDNDLITTNTLSDSDTCSGGSGNGCGTHNESGTSVTGFVQRFNSAMEFEFTVKPSGPQPSTVYYFRAYNWVASRAVELNSGETYPSLTAEGASLSFQVLGVNSGTVTEGITTDITTTPASVSFSSLSVDTETEGAQKIRVTTNAPNGYTTYLFRTAPSANEYGNVIGDVSGTNAVPAAWGIPGGQNSAFGYHTSDASLGTGTANRFLVDDTYAALDETAREVAYNGGSVIDEETDIVYKIEINSLQEAGTYDTKFEYIVVPVF